MTLIGKHEYTRQDITGTLRPIPVWWDFLLDGREPTAEVAAEIIGLREQQAIVLDDTALDPADQLARSLGLIGRATSLLRASGTMPSRRTGTVAHLARSNGGLPKLAVERVEIDTGGVVGDRQGNRKHHGRPWQAMCLWSTEVIDAFAAGGDPIAAGAAGENITITGIDWSIIQIGVRLRAGTALLECSLWALPCSDTAHCFHDRDFNRMNHTRGPVSRMYAWVIEPGEVSVGDPVIVEP